MTNLSIIGRLEALERDGRLYTYVPELPAIPKGRRWVWLTRGAMEWYKHPGKEFKESSFAMAIQQLDNFVNGFELENEIDLKQLDTRDAAEVWEIRTVMQQPRIRLFGWFPCPKHFVFVHAKIRPNLGNRGDPKWERAIRKVVETRRELLPGIAVYSGNRFEDYVG